MTAASGRLLLLRHAWAGDRESWDGDDRVRPLDARGRAQAEQLPGRLLAAGFGDALLVSSPHLRCMATLRPFADAVGTSIDDDELLGEVAVPERSSDGWPDAAWLGARGLEALDRARAAAAGRPVVLCSHGALLPALLAAYAGRAGLWLPERVDLARKALPKGAGWIVREGDDPPVRVFAAP
jgi:8-oxo-(d)GTP phosphatase